MAQTSLASVSATSQACMFPLETFQTNEGFCRPGEKEVLSLSLSLRVKSGLEQVSPSLWAEALGALAAQPGRAGRGDLSGL